MVDKSTIDIGDWLDDKTKSLIAKIYTFDNLDSTNLFLTDKLLNKTNDKSLEKVNICIAKNQQNGIGRRNNRWVSDGKNISFSIGQAFNLLPQNLVNLSIVTGLIVAKVLQRHGLSKIKLKWPNDLFYDDKKLGGILVELQPIRQQSLAIIGIGINGMITKASAHKIDQNWIDLSQIIPDFSTNKIIAEIINQLLPILNDYPKKSQEIMNDWDDFDWTKNQMVVVKNTHNNSVGIAKGITEFGALKVQINNELQVFYSGEVSLRKPTTI